ncbi:uncharacterized protein [Coffea arabica]|uniref:Uncharacterized protein n=1 Tax=Coffea arabica TaxID=13443 RepID=A0A6P6WN70_COFAR|nr:pentatricopeptide repeat-containing protein At3g22670, mitochondrial-like [Coffea arabica]
MPSRLRLFHSFWHFRARISSTRFTTDVRYVSDGNHFLWNPFCTVAESVQVEDSVVVTVESPGLPHWVKSSNNEVNNVEDEEFVLPSVSDWIDSHELHRPGVDTESKVGDLSDSEADKISKILKSEFKSQDAVLEALNGCRVDVTEDLVKQILERFSFDWIPCLGFFRWAKLQGGFKLSPELYNLMIDNLGKLRKFDLMFDLVEEMRQLEGCITLVTISKVIRRLAKAGRFVDAIDVFRNSDQYGVPKDIYALNILVDALIKDRGVEHAEEVILEYKDIVSPNASTFNMLVHGWCRARKLGEARKTVGKMKRHGFNPDVVTYTCFIELYCRDKDFRKVDRKLKAMQELGLMPSVVTYTIIVTALGKAKEMNRALEYYEMMNQNGCVPDSSFYSTLIENLSKSGRLKDARELFEDMAKQGVDPDTLTYNTMIAASARHSEELDALMLLKQMEERQCKPDLQTYAPLLKMCCRLRRMKVLSFLLRHMFKNNISFDLGTYTLLVSGLCAHGNLNRACSFFEESVKRGFVPTDAMYRKLVKGLQEKGMEKEKERIEELMLQAKVQGSIDSSKSFIQVQE